MGSLVYVFSERCGGKRPSRFRAIGAAIAGVVLAADERVSRE
jgi:hypothetical protein